MAREQVAPGVVQIGQEVIRVTYHEHEQPIDWPAIFGRSAPMALEIGSGSGEFLTRIAAENPGIDHVALEIKNKRVAKFANRIRRQGLANIRVVHGEAAWLLGGLFMPGCLRTVYFLFPDPWPKKRHHKHRFLNPYTLEILHDLLESGGQLHMATDHADYLEVMKQTVAGHSGFEGPTYEAADSPFGFPTRYETYWMAEGRTITYLSYVKA